jgi:hypothetical protein
MKRRRFIVGAGVASVLIASGGTFALSREDGGGEDSAGADTEDSDSATTTAQVERRDLEERQELDGTLGYGDPTEVSLQAQGTITALPALGAVIDRGQSLVEIDGGPMPLLFGDRPFWRTLDESSENGLDIQELEENLVALGFATSDTLTVDTDWTAATTTAVKKWQKSLGRDETGVVAPADAVVLPGAVRVAEHPTPVGSPAGGGPVLKVTSTARQVTIDLEATQQSLVTLDQPVQVELPDGSVVPGKVSDIGRVAEANEDDSDQPGAEDQPATIEVTVTLDDPNAGAAYDEAPVSVSVVTSAAQGVLAVPVNALLALSEGGFAVEVVGAGPGGTSELVAVETGAFADGWVEVTGEIAEGDEVVVPA